jgi:transcription-repair coupling factor (superfamily II helicase)
VQQLLRYAALRMKAVEAGVISIERKRDLVSIKFRQDAPIDPVKLASFVSSHRGSQFLPDGTLKFMARNAGAQELLDQLDHLLQTLAEQKTSPSLA